MGAVESNEAVSGTEQTGKVRRRYCGNFLGGDEPEAGETVVKHQRSPSIQSRTLSAAPSSPSLTAADAPAGSAEEGAAANGYMSSPSETKRTLAVNVPGSGSNSSPSGSPQPPVRELSEREKQEKEIAEAKEAKRALRKSQQLNKKLIKQIKKETVAEERARIREEIAQQQAEREHAAVLAQADFEQKSWSLAVEKYRADRRSRSMVPLPPTLDIAVKYLAAKENKRKCIILGIASLERCELDLAAAQQIDHDDATKQAMSPGTATRALSGSKSGKEKEKEKDSKKKGDTKGPEVDAKGDLALKDHYAFRFAIRNPSNGVESVGEAWAIVYKSIAPAATADTDGLRPCTIGECIGGWTKK